MEVVEKIFYTENESLAENEDLKMKGFKYEAARTLGINKDGWYFLIKAEKKWFEEREEIFKDLEEVIGEEKKEVLNKFKKLEERKISGISSMF